MLEAQKQQHLRSLRRTLNRAVTSLKDGSRIVFHTGWAYGIGFTDDYLDAPLESKLPEVEDEQELFLLLPPDMAEEKALGLVPEGLRKLVSFFWPGPLHIRVRIPATREKITLACPWQELPKELLTRQGALLWTCLEPSLVESVEGDNEALEMGGQTLRTLRWPEPISPVSPTLIDATTLPWRLLSQGFLEADEILAQVEDALVLSEDRAFPGRRIRTYVPQGKTVVVEAEDHSLIPEAVKSLREQVPPDSFIRIYLDEKTAHNHFPDDREVRVYGELSDLERVRRRLQAMLERQNRRLGKRVLLIAIDKIGPESESFRVDLEKLSDRWLTYDGKSELQLGEV